MMTAQPLYKPVTHCVARSHNQVVSLWRAPKESVRIGHIELGESFLVLEVISKLSKPFELKVLTTTGLIGYVEVTTKAGYFL